MTPIKLKLTIRLDDFVQCIVTLIFVQVQNAPHEAKLSHELIAAAASYEVRVLIYIVSHLPNLQWYPIYHEQAAKAYNEHCDREGQPQSHETAKEIL